MERISQAVYELKGVKRKIPAAAKTAPVATSSAASEESEA